MHKIVASLILCAGLTSAVPALAASPGGNLNLFLGAKTLDENDWLANVHGELGLMFDIGGENWPVALAVDLLGSSGDFDGLVYSYWDRGIYYYEEEVRTRELNLGVRKYWEVQGNMYPYFGGGLALVELKAKGRLDGGPTYRDSGSGNGLWLGGGIQWRFEQFNLGFDIRTSFAEVDLASGDYQGGGGHAGVVMGVNW